jgi:outer membrane usher protein
MDRHCLDVDCRRFRALIGRWLLILSAASSTASAIDIAAQDDWEPMVVSLTVNRQSPAQSIIAYRDQAGEWCVPADALSSANVVIDPTVVVSRPGTNACVRLSSLNPVTILLDDSTQGLAIELPPERFTTTGLSPGGLRKPLRVTRSPSGFLNYDLILEKSSIDSGYYLYAEGGLSKGPGVFITNYAFTDQPQRSGRLRLETNYVIDQPEHLATWRIGDTISRPATVLGRSVRFGGIQLASNFGTQPGYLTSPLPVLSAQAALPSTVDLYINNTLQSSTTIPPGPFSVVTPPMLSGEGEVLMRVRDLSGREELISQRFYAGGSLLAQGLNDFSLEAGLLRRNFGIDSNNYGDAFASGAWRHGVSQRLTSELGAAVGEGRQTGLYGGASFAAPGLGLVTGAIAWGRKGPDYGTSASLGFERRWRRHSLSLRTQYADQGFRQLGVDSEFRLKRLNSLFYGYQIDGVGSISLAFMQMERFDDRPVQVDSLAFSTRSSEWGSWMISLNRTRAVTTDHSINVLWSLPLGPGVSASAFHTRPSDGDSRTTLQWQKSLPSDEGYGVRLQAGVNAPQQASLQMQGRYGLARVEAASFDGDTSARVGLGGAIAFVDNEWFAGRRIGGSFGVVRLPGEPNVRVYVDNLPVGRTDEKGTAFLPRLNAYTRNNVQVEPLDLPLDIEVGSLLAEPVPAWRSGTRVEFQIRRIAAATLNLFQKNGAPVPAGAITRIKGTAHSNTGGDDDFFVVGHDGLVYLTGLTQFNVLLVKWVGGQCTVDLPYEAKKGSVPYLGEFVCHTGAGQ